MMKKAIVAFCGLLVLCLTLLYPKASADLLVFTPQDMISNSTSIITGTVVEKEDGQDHRRVIIRTKKVIKGDSPGELLVLERNNSPFGLIGFEFPEAGKDVLLFLQGKDVLTGDANNVATIEAGNIAIVYQGLAINAHPVDEYNKVYSELISSKTSMAAIGNTALMIAFAAVGIMIWAIESRRGKR